MSYNEIYLILGCSSEIGCELLRQLNKEKSNALFIAHYFSNDIEIKKIIPFNENEIQCVQANLGKIQDVQNLIECVKIHSEAPTHIVHFPALKFEFLKLKQLVWSEFLVDMEIQVHSLAEILMEFLPIMAKRKDNNKVVVLLSSNTISAPPKFTLKYNMVKYTLLGMVKSLAADYAGKMVNINGISPSMVETQFLSNIDSRIIEVNASNSNGKRNATVSDIIPSIKFLLSNDSDFLNGVNLNVSNGNIM